MKNGVITRMRRAAVRGALVLPLLLAMGTAAWAQGVAMVRWNWQPELHSGAYPSRISHCLCIPKNR